MMTTVTLPYNSHQERTISAALRAAPLAAQMPSRYADSWEADGAVDTSLLAAGPWIGGRMSVTAQGSEDEQAIRQVIARFADAWNRHDMTSLAQLFSEDADFVVITGRHLKGRSEIEMHHGELQKTGYKDSHLLWRPTKVRFIRPAVAVAHVATEITFHEGRDKRTSFATLVLTKQGHEWLIEALQNTLTNSAPVPGEASAGSA